MALVAAAACNLTVGTSGLEGDDTAADSGSDSASGLDATLPTADAGARDATTGVPMPDSAAPADAMLPEVDAATRDAQVDAGPPVDPDFIGYWNFNEDAGAPWADDHSGNGNDAVKMYFSNGAAVGGVGRTGGALLVPNATSAGHVMALDSPAFPIAGTLSVWVRFPKPDGGSSAISGFFDYGFTPNVLHFYAAYQGNADFAFVLQAPGCPQGGNYCAYDDEISVPPDATGWTHIIWTWDFSGATGTYSIYANPQLNPTAVAGGTSVADAGPFSMQLLFQGSNDLQNRFDDIKMYKRVLSLDEIITLQ